ncbi:HU family DNA-binding protein [Bacteroidaceae bacterium HV4-6-C5C]|jgi:Bacterial nucleoid DNA-binding protein|nr:HU family DNA-binding protein [Bacteroidaceae bacterium HV4-6-C5C]
MNNKEFTSELSRRLGYTTKDTSDIISALLTEITNQLSDGNAISAQGFGTFEVRKKAERISVNPVSKIRMLVPPKLVLSFKPSPGLKDKFK